jgi:adenosylcobinamide kinase/adenosylcobinamide-phosphate guanylyltransferase
VIVLITGGSGSGKSEYGENLALKLNQNKNLTYIATMYPYGEETLQKIERHKEMRAGKGFETIECFHGLKDIKKPIHSTVLLECMSNLLANELYMEEGAKEMAFDEIMGGIRLLASKADNLIVISNEVFSDSALLDKEMVQYVNLLGRINQHIAKMADVVCEVVYSIPIFHKGDNNDLEQF